MRTTPFVLSALVLAALPARGHEFWISPQTYTVPAQGQLTADLRVGENFEGVAYAYLPQNFERFDLVAGAQVVAVEGRPGDRPALAMPAPTEGLVVVVHQTGDSTLTWDTAQNFEDFVRHKDMAWALEENRARGIPETGFREVYSRYAKSLIAVGEGAGEDGAAGLETEIVALANPYTDALPDGLPVKVLYRGEPRADAQVEVFAKAPDGTVQDLFYRTDAQGVALIPVVPGVEYLVDAVVLRAVEPQTETDPVWETLWASLTFRMPAD